MLDTQTTSNIATRTESTTRPAQAVINYANMKFGVLQLADMFGVSKTAIYDLEREGKLKGEVVAHGKTEKRIYSWEDVTVIADRFSNRIPRPRNLKTKVFANMKGGVGKSTVSSQFAMRAAAMGIKTLMIDCDPQAHASQSLGFKERDLLERPTIRDIIIDEKAHEECVVAVTPFLHLIPSNLSLSSLEMELFPKNARERKIPMFLQSVRDKYELIVVDTNPSASIVNLSSILGADELCVVAATDHMAVTGISKIMTILQQLEQDFEAVPPVRVIANLFDVRESMAQESIGFLRQNFGDILVKTVIRKNQDLKEANKRGQAIWQYNKNSTGSEDIISLTMDLLVEGN
jgi:chromosome partitioning protein